MVGGIGAVAIKRRARQLIREANRLGLEPTLEQVIRNPDYWERAVYLAHKAQERKEQENES